MEGPAVSNNFRAMLCLLDDSSCLGNATLTTLVIPERSEVEGPAVCQFSHRLVSPMFFQPFTTRLKSCPDTKHEFFRSIGSP